MEKSKQTIEKDKWVTLDIEKGIETCVYVPSNYPGPIAIDAKIKPEEIVEDLDKDLGDGPLTLGVFCTKCNAQFELNGEGVAMATILNTSFLEYLRYVQSSPCPKCVETVDE